MRHIERARAEPAGQINAELTRGARFHLIRTSGYITYLRAHVAEAQLNVHGEDAIRKAAELKAKTGETLQVYSDGQEVAITNPKPRFPTEGYIAVPHEKANLPEIEG